MCEQSVVQGGRPLLSLLFKPLALQPPFSLIVDPFFIFFFPSSEKQTSLRFKAP